jgi:hypothetical protein
MERVIRIAVESTWVRPNELSKYQIDILKYSNGCYFARFKKWDHTGKVLTFKDELPTRTVTDILELLRTIQIPAFPRHMMGCDGGFTEIEVGGYGGKSHFRWWSAPPNGWEQLDQVAAELIERSGFYDLMDNHGDVSTKQAADVHMKTNKGPTYEFQPLCSKCGKVASTIQLFNDSGKWRLVYEGSDAGSGPSGDEITPEAARAMITGFTQPYTKQGVRAAGFYDDGGFCLECRQFYCPTHWNISTTGGGTCPKGHFKSLDPHWSPD